MMRRVLFLLCLFLLIPITVLAQDGGEPSPITDDAAARAEAAAARAEAAAQLADTSAEHAARYAGDASNFLGIFEAISVAITLIVGALGVFGVVRLFSAQAELTRTGKAVKENLSAAQTKFEAALRAKQDELDALKDELRRSAESERLKSEQATLALSLLPLGERQYRVKDFDGALTTYRHALELDPDNLVTHYRLGYVYTQMGRLDEAIAHLNRALELQADFAPALAAMGYVYRLQAQPLTIQDIKRGELLAEAERRLRQALAISPKLVDEDGESWWGSLGGLHRRRGQLDDAIECYTRAQEVTPQASYPLGNLALLYLLKNDRPRMMQTYQRAERLAARRALVDVTDFWAWADLLVARLALGKAQEAEEIIDSVFAAAPASAPEILNNPLATLRQLADTLGGEPAARIQPFIERIEARARPNGRQPVG